MVPVPEKKPPIIDKAVSGGVKRARKRPRKITETYLHNAGLAYLQRFAASEQTFRQTMNRKIARSCREHPEQDAEKCAALLDALVAKFIRSGLLNDTQYAATSVFGLRSRGCSRRAVQAKLAAKGLAAELIAEALRKADEELGASPGDAELAGAVRLARRRKFGPFEGVRPVDMKKALAAFARAGFSYETAMRAMTLTREEAELSLSFRS